MRLVLATCLAGIWLVAGCSNGADAGGRGKCEAPLLDCGEGACLDPAGDPRHCGGCGRACGTDEACLASTCVPLRCAEGESVCDHACVDLAVDIAHCGSCEVSCFAGQTCEAGTCTCPGSATACEGGCVDTATDVSHCGECGRECAAGQVCRQGTCAPAACEGTVLLPGLPEFELGGAVRHAELADWDGDGDLDLLAALVEPREIRLFANRGDGVFEPKGSVAGTRSGFFRTVDFDGDGDLDLAIADPAEPGTLVIITQDPVPRTATAFLGTTEPVVEFLQADVDGEPGEELVVATAGGLRIEFGDARPVTVDAQGPRHLRVAELGGRTALLAATETGILVVRLGGVVDVSVSSVGPAAFPGQFELADLDGDGDLDLVSAAGVLLRNRGDGFFDPWEVALPSVSGLAVADLDGDGRLDLAFARSGELPTFRGTADGPTPGRTIPAAPGLSWIRAAPLDRADGVDLLAVDTALGHAVVLGGDGAGAFPGRFRMNRFTGAGPRIGIAQVWGSSAGELLVGFRDRPQVGVMRLSRYGMAEVASFEVGHGVEDLALGDVDGDGYADLLAADRAGDAISVALSNPGAGFASPERIPVGDGPTRILLADVDDDGARDLAVLEAEGQTLRVIRNRAWTDETTVALPEVPHEMAVGDVNGDGAPDFVVATETQLALAWGDGRGGFALAGDFGLVTRAVATGDLDGDGVDEVLSLGPEALAMLQITDEGLKIAALHHLSGGVAVAVADLDTDGRRDVLVLQDDGRVQFFRNIGGPELVPAGRWAALSAPLGPGETAALALVDADRDGRPEVIVAGEHEQSWLLPGCLVDETVDANR